MKKPVARVANTVRIIGGSHRSRKISFPAGDGLRPTPDRVRETLFNWLQQDIVASSCLDLFAGSGALGLEALSRGASELVFVDSNQAVANALRENLEQLQFANAEVVNAEAVSWLKSARTRQRTFDVIFLDPPFSGPDIYRVCAEVDSAGIMNVNCRVYVETGNIIDPSLLPQQWVVMKASRAGQVHFSLLSRQEK